MAAGRGSWCYNIYRSEGYNINDYYDGMGGGCSLETEYLGGNDVGGEKMKRCS